MLNLTPYDIVVMVDGVEKVFPKSGSVIRLDTEQKLEGFVDGIPVYAKVVTGIHGLPADDSVKIIVSGMVNDYIREKGLRKPFSTFSPDTGSTAIRNEKGHIVAVVNLLVAF